MLKRPVLIDTDPGVDDAFAIMLAQSFKSIDIVGLTVTSGNVSLNHTLRNTLGLCEAINMDVPVYKGATAPLVEQARYADEFHGNNGFGGYEFNEIKKQPESMPAWDAIRYYAEKYDGELEILSLGPPTNIAIALLKYPELNTMIKRIVFMGGSLTTGNTEPLSEFNFWCDPHATQVVFNSNISMQMVGLDVTRQGLLPLEDLKEIKSENPKFEHLLRYLSDFYAGISHRSGYGSNLHIPDAVAAFAFCYPEHCSWQPMNIKCITSTGRMQGWTKVDHCINTNAKPNVLAATSTNQAEFIKCMKGVG